MALAAIRCDEEMLLFVTDADRSRKPKLPKKRFVKKIINRSIKRIPEKKKT